MTLRTQDDKKLEGVHPDLSRVVRKASEYSGDIAFIVTEGLRTKERQEQLVAAGKSKTMNSRHLTGHAVDLAAWIDKDADKVVDVDEIDWRFPLYVDIAKYVQIAAIELCVPVVWGACWCRINRTGDVEKFVEEYKYHKSCEGGKPFIDAPHFELDRGFYP